MYVNCKTNYSFRYGTFFTQELVRSAAEFGAKTLALTNINNTCDAWDFVLHCQKQNIKPILGAEIRNGDKLLYILIARNSEGFAVINQFLSYHLLLKEDFPAKPPLGIDVAIIYPLRYFNYTIPSFLLENEFIGIQPTEINRIFGQALATGMINKLLIRQPVTFQNKRYFNVHKLLRCVDNNVLSSKLSTETLCGSNEYFVPVAELLQTFKDYPFIVTNTLRFMDECNIEMDFATDKNKKIFSATAQDDRIFLSKLAHDGLITRYGKKNKTAAQRLETELSIINNLNFNAYFLITWDLIRYAQSRGYYHVGRGSGANSIVAYCLKITDVDPIGLDLFFERFLNPHRAVPPDFDIDFSWTDRDDVIDYVFKRYGKDHVALLGMHPTFQYNAIVRELGKVFGLPKSEIDELTEKRYYNGDSRSENFKRNDDDNIKRLILHYGKLIENFPDNLSIHAGGILISERPLSHYTPVFMPPKGFATTQIDMYVAEDIGLYKWDVLSQRGLGHIKECLQLIRTNKGQDIDIHRLEKFKKDDNIRQHIR
ncbi:MAG TPA: PHP domain-containing protein, partial [Chitinophagaceae bacterium]